MGASWTSRDRRSNVSPMDDERFSSYQQEFRDRCAAKVAERRELETLRGRVFTEQEARTLVALARQAGFDEAWSETHGVSTDPEQPPSQFEDLVRSMVADA